MSGFIKLHRQLIEWEWYKDSNTMRVFLHCLLKANNTDKTYRGLQVVRGQLVTGRDVLAESLGLTVSQVRTSLDKLESTNEITLVKNRKGTIITINNYDNYQINDAEQKAVTPVKKIKSIEDRIYDFKKSLVPHLDKYGKTVLKNFSDYWTEKSPRGSKMRFEKEKVFDVSRRLATWSRNNFNNTNQPTQADDHLTQHIKNQLKK
ncbi:hypothetical protein [uncultured Mediterranean phage uvMED]|nr:hypothetical protein [uncultured Mediterranean phage uvMED]